MCYSEDHCCNHLEEQYVRQKLDTREIKKELKAQCLCLNFTLHPLFHCCVDISSGNVPVPKISLSTVGASKISFSLSVKGATLHTAGLWEFDFNVFNLCLKI